MLKLQIPKNLMNALIEWIRDSSDPERLERGWDHYHKGRLTAAELLHGVEIHGTISEAISCEVVLQLDDMSRSECTCTGTPGCEHMAALLFALYASYGRPELLLQQLKQAMLIKQKQKEARTSTRKKKADPLTAPAANQAPSSWHKYFEQRFYGYLLSQQHSVDAFFSTAKETLLVHSKDWPPALQQLYTLHVLLFALKRISRFYHESKTSYMSYYIENGTRTTGKQCMDEMLEFIGELDIEAIVKSKPKSWKETLSMIAEAALSPDESPISWINLYRGVWWRMGYFPDWVDAEKARMDQRMRQEELPPKQMDLLLMASAHFCVMRGNDDEARQRLEALHRREARDFFQYLQRCYHTGQWERMLAWLRWLLPVVRRASQEELRPFCQYWIEAVQHQQDDSEWIEVMKELLPRTYSFYTAYLLKARRYQAWIDLQLAGRVSPQELYSLDVQAVERHNPALLLPLYHQAVERSIAEKNRSSYQNAVRSLRKLQAIYKQLGKQAVWERYIHQLAVKHSRLRALLEELRKGKWIP